MLNLPSLNVPSWLGRKPQDPADFTWATNPKKLVEFEVVGCLVRSLVSTSKTIDGFVTWMFAGTGAATALIVANINSISLHFVDGGLHWLFWILGLSAVAGLVSKVFALMNQISIDSIKAVSEEIKPIIEAHQDHFPIEKFFEAIRSFIEIIPWSGRFIALSTLRKTAENPLYVHKRLAARFQIQVLSALAQITLLIATAFCVALSLKGP